jgi:hypothetical protein
MEVMKDMVETATNLDELETWENISHSRFVLKKFSARGELQGELINGKRKFHVTTRERHINQEIAATPGLDPFSNGMFAPVRLLDTTEDAAEIAANPNLLGESDMVDLVKGRVDSLKKRLADVENSVVLQRLLEVAKEQDVQASKLDAIKARIDEVSPSIAVEIDSPVSR